MIKIKIVQFDYEEKHDNELVRVKSALLGDAKVPLSLEELIALFETSDVDAFYVQDLEGIYGLFEPIIKKRNWQLKVTNGEFYTSYNNLSAIKGQSETLYTIAMFGKKRRCNTITIRQKDGHIVKIYNYEKWSKFTEEELNELQPTTSTPASFGRSMLFGRLGTNTNWSKEKAQFYFFITNGKSGGFIHSDYPRTFVKLAYHYDITSMYPYVVSQIKRWPNPATAKYTEDEEVADHERYAYWIWQNDEYVCNTTIDKVPKGTIKMALIIPNKMREQMIELSNKKVTAEKGSTDYKFYKIVMNTAIGSLNQRTKLDEFYPFYYTNEGKKEKKRVKPFNYIERFTYVIAKAKERIMKELDSAKQQGAVILQVNTDGFFTDKPIIHDEERFLGSLRLEYVAHNLRIFACNQYACDEEVCMSGVPAEDYIEGKQEYSFFVIDYSEKGPVWKEQKTTLGEIKYEYMEYNED